MSGRRDEIAAHPLPVDGETIHAICDIHGRTDLLDAIDAAIDRETAERGGPSIEIRLGDHVDRGPDSAGVIERRLQRAVDHRLVLLPANHEELFAAFLGGEVDPEEWRPVGGLETLMSYGVDVAAPAGRPQAARARVPASHRAFLDRLVDFHRAGGYSSPMPASGRAWRSTSRRARISCGSARSSSATSATTVRWWCTATPSMEAELLPNRIDIDTGTYLTDRLTCLQVGADGLNLIATGPRPNA